jgi:anaerobic magnesium-protoporphyrin IX monomethyl ester cyclase
MLLEESAMKVLLVNSASLYIKQKPAIPLGLLSIATFLSGKGHTVKICDRAIDNCKIRKVIDCFSPDIVGISAISFRNFDDAIKVSEIAKKSSLPVVWGGSTTSLVPDIVLKTGVVDYVIIGEGELTWLSLLNTLEEKKSLYEVAGLAFIVNGEIIVNQDREFADLSQLPVIDFRFVDPSKYFVRNIGCERMLFMYSSKGCPGQCTFCYSPAFSKCVWRPRPPEHYLEEIKYLVDNYHMDGVTFADDSLCSNREYLHEFCRRIKESGINFVWGCEFRADKCGREDLQLLYNAGCRWMFFGIESGCEQRQMSIKKKINLKKAKETIKHCKEIGIVTTTSCMIGFPDETEEELKLTLRFMHDLNSDLMIASIFGPIPKSEIYEDLIKSNRLSTPQSYSEWKKLKWMDSVGKNFSRIPDLDLKVVSCCVLLKIFNNATESRCLEKKDTGANT